ncbi:MULTISPECIES: hypothetical protein [unclassified Kitasatospora]|uniref:hypothetical protein n=1 Tax=unclassified Kitasatospora TaxID=2633591 RepID=UPI003829E277
MLPVTVAGVPAAHAATGDACGGAISDYVGLAGLDAPFTGTASSNGINRTLTVTPLLLGSNTVKAEIADGTDDRYAIGSFKLTVNNSGFGKIEFIVPGGHGRSENVVCESGSRVTEITGKVFVQDLGRHIPFTITRA